MNDKAPRRARHGPEPHHKDAYLLDGMMGFAGRAVAGLEARAIGELAGMLLLGTLAAGHRGFHLGTVKRW